MSVHAANQYGRAQQPGQAGDRVAGGDVHSPARRADISEDL